jgi:hypothetical protein
MARGRPKAALVLSAEQRAQLESMASSGSLPAGLVTRVRIVLLSAAHRFLAITKTGGTSAFKDLKTSTLNSRLARSSSTTRSLSGVISRSSSKPNLARPSLRVKINSGSA